MYRVFDSADALRADVAASSRAQDHHEDIWCVGEGCSMHDA
jgi:hypothetical protein